MVSSGVLWPRGHLQSFGHVTCESSGHRLRLVLRFVSNKCTGCCYILEEYVLLTKGTNEISYKCF